MKNKKYETVKKYWDIIKGRDLIYAILCLIVFVVLLIIWKVTSTSTVWELIGVDLFFAVIAAFVLKSLAAIIEKIIKHWKEDNLKLSTDYNTLCKMYSKNKDVLVKHQNIGSTQENIIEGRKNTSCIPEKDEEDTYIIPVAEVVLLENKKVILDDSNKDKMYQLPPKVEEKMSALFDAHSESKLYNQLTIRCTGVQDDEKEVKMSFERTTYYYSLLTNRAIDYKIDGLSVRDLYAYGPDIIPLEKSQLSNHMGYNGVVETSDKQVVFIRRNNKVSVAKNLLQVSVTASLKAKFALNDNGELTKEGIETAIKKEIVDELNLENLERYKEREKDIFGDFSFENNVVYFYREMVEGGKPQFLFYAKLNIESKELIEAYTTGVKKIKNEKDLYPKMDGYKMLLVPRNEIKNIYITPDGLTINGKFYKSNPTNAASLSLIMKRFFNETN